MHIGLVLVEQNGERFLFRTPAWSSIEVGDTVVVEGDKTGKVVGTVSSIFTDDNYYDFIIKTANTKTPLPKVLGKLEYVECRYFTEENDG